MFAIMMIAIGIWGFAQSGFVAIWAPGIQPAGLRAPTAIVCSLVSTVTGGGLLFQRYASVAARLLLGFLSIWLVWCKGPPLIHAPADLASWESAGETLVLISAAWALATPDAKSPIADGPPGPRILYGIALVTFGASHLAYVTPTAGLVPAWLPWHAAWVYFTAATYIAAGAALAVGSRPAAVLSTLQMALFSLLVWVPRILEGSRDAGTLNETAISFALAASGWVISMHMGIPSHRLAAEPRFGP